MEIRKGVVAVTGSTSGLGEATVRHFSRLGARVAIWDTDAEKGAALAKGARCDDTVPSEARQAG